MDSPLERASPSAAGQYGTLLPPERHTVSTFQAGVALFKAVVGPGVLFLPSAVKNAGLVSALGVSLVCGVLAIWCLLLVLDTAQVLRRNGYTIKTMSDIGLAVYGVYGQVMVDVCVVISQLGFCIAYCVFVAENVQAFLFELAGGMVGAADNPATCNLTGFLADEKLVYYIILILIPFLIPVTWLRQIKYFAVSNTIASTLVVVSLAYMLVLLGHRYATAKSPGEGLLLYNLHGTLVYLGTAMYAFEGVAVLLPVEDKMETPQLMPQVVCWTLGFALFLQISFAFIAYLNYRGRTQSIVTISLADGQIAGGIASVVFVQLAWVVEVLLTFPLQLFPAVRILEHSCSITERNSGLKWTKNLMRAGIVLLCMLVSLFGYTSVDNMVSMIGALGCIPLAITYPALFHYKVKHDFPVCEQDGDSEESTSTCLLQDGCKPQVEKSDLAIVIMGILSTVTATIMAVISWSSTDFHFQSCVLRH